MAATVHPRSLIDVLVNLFAGQLTPQVQTPGQVLDVIDLATGGLTTAGLALTTATLIANSTYVAVGTGRQAFAVGLTHLATEFARVPVTARYTDGTYAFVQGYFAPNQANAILSEIGIFGGAATGVSGSGTLYAYVVPRLPRIKHGQLSLTQSYAPA